MSKSKKPKKLILEDCGSWYKQSLEIVGDKGEEHIALSYEDLKMEEIPVVIEWLEKAYAWYLRGKK